MPTTRDLFPSHDPVYDMTNISPSRMGTYLDCRRKYFYTYVMGWKEENTSHHLQFGTAWHDAMEELLVKGYTNDGIKSAFQLFLAKWREKYPDPADDHMYEPKSPAVVMRGLVDYVDRYKDVDKFDTMYTEIAGTVPVGETEDVYSLLPEGASKERSVRFRMDAIVRKHENDKVVGIDHKTTQKWNMKEWVDQWTLDIQMHSYLHVLHCVYDPKEVDQMMVSGAQFKKGTKTKPSTVVFERVPFRKQGDMMNAWLWEFNHYIDMLEWDFHALFEENTQDSQVLQAFPRNTNACTKYFGCPYAAFCGVWSNPLKRVDEVPAGFQLEHRRPLEEDVGKVTVEKTSDGLKLKEVEKDAKQETT